LLEFACGQRWLDPGGKSMDAITVEIITRRNIEVDFQGLRVGSLEEINNNAGNWE
jgi:hypothetical protein